MDKNVSTWNNITDSGPVTYEFMMFSLFNVSRDIPIYLMLYLLSCDSLLLFFFFFYICPIIYKVKMDLCLGKHLFVWLHKYKQQSQ